MTSTPLSPTAEQTEKLDTTITTLQTEPLLKNCPRCQAQMIVDSYTGLTWKEGREVAYERGMGQFLNMVVCDTCCAMLDAQNRRDNQKQRARSARDTSINYGWIQLDTLKNRFEKSRRDTENETKDIAKAFEWGREWRPMQPKNSAFIEGTQGAGKTYFAHCVLNRALKYGRTVREISALEIQDLAMDFEHKAAARKQLNLVKRVGCLLIEELGLVNWTEYGVIELRDIIDHRFRNHLPILITSNLSIRELRTQVWEAPDSKIKNKSIVGPMLDRMQNFVGLKFIRMTAAGKPKSLRYSARNQEELF